MAGTIEFIEGDVLFLDAKQLTRRPKLQDPIHQGDSIVTGADGEVHLRMADSGLIAVRPKTRMRIVEFRAEGDAEDRATLGLLEGTFRSITGWIAKFQGPRYLVRTPTATIGVRGTDHEPLHIAEGGTLGEPGTYDKVNEGRTFIESKFGRVNVAPGRAGFAALRRAPRVLERIPRFFRPTRNEARVARRHEEIQRRLDERREERKKEIQERRDKLKEKTEERREALKEKAEERREVLEERREALEQKQREAREQREQRQEQLRERREERRQAVEEKRRGAREQREERQEQLRRGREERRGEAERRQGEARERQMERRQQFEQRQRREVERTRREK